MGNGVGLETVGETGSAHDRVKALEDELRRERHRVEQLRAREGRLINQLKQATLALGRVESEQARLLAREAEFERTREAQYWLDVLLGSRSIRVTAPLRRISRFVADRRR